jgi:hypothetical protein
MVITYLEQSEKVELSGLVDGQNRSSGRALRTERGLADGRRRESTVASRRVVVLIVRR